MEKIIAVLIILLILIYIKKTKISIPILKMVDVLMAFGDFTYEDICRIIYESVLRLYYDAEEGE